jgi:hypothetical protein
MEWIGRTATLAVGFLLLAGCRPPEPEPSNIDPIVAPVAETVAADVGPPMADPPTEPEVEEIPPEPQEMPPEPAEEADEPIDDEIDPKDTIGASIEDGAIGAVAKALWRSVLGEAEPLSDTDSPPDEEPPPEETPPSEP